MSAQFVTPLHIESGTVIGLNVYIERECHIGDGVTIRNAVLLRESVAPDGTVVHIYGLTDAVALGAKPGILFWMLLGLIAALFEQARSSQPETPRV